MKQLIGSTGINKVKITLKGAKAVDSSKKMKNTKNNKKEDGKFDTKQIKHDPQAEGARAVFGKDK